MSDTLLTYDFKTEPEPLVASPPAGDPALAAVTVEVTNDGQKIVDCRRIAFALPVGENAKDFCADPTGVGVTRPAGWNVTQSGGLFVAAPATADAGKIGRDALTFTFSKIKVNRRPGTCFLRITEEAGAGADAGQRKASLQLTKFPSVPDASFDIDAPAVREGGGVTLTWDAEGGGTYVIEYGDVRITHPKNDPARPLPPRGSYRVEGLRDNPTVFHLTASYHVEGHDRPVVVRRQYAVTVNPLKPEIKLFRGELLAAKDGQHLALTWDAANADHCTLTGVHHLLRPSCAADPYHVELDLRGQHDKTYELSAVRAGAGADAVSLTAGWQLEETGGAALDQSQHGVAVSPDGGRLYVAGLVNRVPVIQALDARTLQPLGARVGTPMDVWRLAASPDGALLYAAGENWGNNERALVLDARTLLRVGEPLSEEPALDVAASPDGKRVYVNYGHKVQVFDARTRQRVGDSGALPKWMPSFALSADGARLYIMDTGSVPAFSIYDAQTLRPVGVNVPLDRDVPSHSMSASPDGRRLYLGGNHDIRVIDAHTFRPVGHSIRHRGGTGHAVSPDGLRLYSLKIDGIAVLSTLSVTGGRGAASR